MNPVEATELLKQLPKHKTNAEFLNNVNLTSVCYLLEELQMGSTPRDGDEGTRPARHKLQETIPHVTETPTAPQSPVQLPSHAPMGQVVAGYVIRGEIGRGGMGTVYTAHDVTLDRAVAIKVLHPGQNNDRFVQEAKITAQLPHPGIPPVYQLGQLPDGRAFLAMKLIEGRTFAELLQEDRTDVPTTHLLSLFERVCETVGFAHSRGIIHRDLKPSNIMIGSYGEVLVMDWGLARSVTAPFTEQVSTTRNTTNQDSAATVAGQVKGTPAYMAPEQARGERVDARADVFALGGILAVILTGRPPFQGNTALDTVLKAASAELQETYALLDKSNADAELVTLCKHCLAPNATGRPTHGNSVARALGKYRYGVERRLQIAKREQEASRIEAEEQRKRRKIQLALSFAVTLLVLGSVGFAWWQESQAKSRQTEREQQEHLRQTQALERQLEDERREVEQQARRQRNSLAIANTLVRAEEALRKNQTLAAGIAVEELSKRLLEAGGEAYRERIEQCRTELRMLQQLDRVDSQRWSSFSSEIDRRVTLAKAWETAFIQFSGQPQGQFFASGSANRIRESHIRETLIQGLDFWHAAAPNAQLSELLRQVDQDKYRDDIRKAIRERNLAKLRELVGEPTAVQQPVHFIVFLGSLNDLDPNRRRLLMMTALAKFPDNERILLGLCETYPINQVDGSAERVRWCQAAVAVNSRNNAAWHNLGVALKDRGEVSEALQCYDRAIELAPNDPDTYYAVGVAHSTNGNHKAAVLAFDKALEREPSFLPAYNNRGASLRALGNNSAAIESFQTGLQHRPTFAAAHYNLGITYDRMGESQRAESAYRDAIRHDPKMLPAYLNLGDLAEKARDLKSAIGWYQQAIVVDSKFAPAHYNLGRIASALGQRDAAVVHYFRAVDSDPNLFPAYFNLGVVLKDNGRWDEAVSAYLNAIRLQPKSAIAHVNLGDIYLKRKNYDLAIAHGKAGIRGDPNFAKAYLLIGFACQESGDIAGAVEAFSAAAKLDKRYAVLLDRLPRRELAPPPREK